MNLAPNGKPSNLNAEQYKLVRTPAFKKWFGDWENDPKNASKVVDENGEPLVVYHASKDKFNVFDKLLEGKRTSAIRDEENKHIYFTSKKIVAETYGKNMYVVFLNIRNPKIINGNRQYIWMLDKEKDKLGENAIIYDTIDFYNAGVPSKVINSFNSMADFEQHYVSNIYAIKDSNQVKLADGSNTKFDADNEDIRYKNGGILPIWNYSIGGL